MKTIEVYVSTGFVGSSKTRTFEVEDDATEEDIEAEALEVLWEMVDFTWYEMKGNE